MRHEEELDLLLGGMDAALGGVGGAAAVYGGAGVGKSRLLATGVRHWLAHDRLGLIGVCFTRRIYASVPGVTSGANILTWPRACQSPSKLPPLS